MAKFAVLSFAEGYSWCWYIHIVVFRDEFSFVRSDVRFGGCFKAKMGLVSWNFSFVDGSVMLLISVDIVLMTCV